MKEHPILFNEEMVKAILTGRKTQTRRVIKVQPSRPDFDRLHTLMSSTASSDRRNIGKHAWGNSTGDAPENDGEYFSAPYGQAGDRLWVRETFDVVRYKASWSPSNGNVCDDEIPASAVCVFADKATKSVELETIRAEEQARRMLAKRCTPSIHMPRWASRITLEITDVRVERVQDISDASALAEGVLELSNCMPPNYDTNAKQYYAARTVGFESPRKAFAHLWDSICSEKYPWESNPWVWVYEFRRIF